jgi:DNA-binding NtrC family response regulator
MVVDDDEETVTLLREILSKEGYSIDTAADGKTALDKISSRSPDLVISDIHMPDLDGMGLLAELRVRHQDVPVILMTAYGSLKTAVDGLRSGAFDYLSKPFIVDDIRLVVRRALEHKNLSRQNQALKEQLRHRYRFDNLVGSSPGIVSVYKSIARVANTESTVLLQGESGTGKELIARAIHANSSRSAGPFVAVDGGSLAETLLESELCGGVQKGPVGKSTSRHLLPRRGRRPFARTARQALACHTRAGDSARRQHHPDEHRCADRGRVQEGSRAARQGRDVPRRLVLPPERRHDQHPAAA